MPRFIITFSFMTTLACMEVKLLKGNIPWTTPIVMSYDNQGISIIDPVTGSFEREWVYIKFFTDRKSQSSYTFDALGPQGFRSQTRVIWIF